MYVNVSCQIWATLSCLPNHCTHKESYETKFSYDKKISDLVFYDKYTGVEVQRSILVSAVRVYIIFTCFS